MDITIPNRNRQRWIRRVALLTVVVLLLAAVTVTVSRVERAAPIVDRESIVIDTVRRGEMVREIAGSGILRPERVWWIPAPAEGRVTKVLHQPGSVLDETAIVVEMSNETIELAKSEAELQLSSARAALRGLEARLSDERLQIEADLAKAEAEKQKAMVDYETLSRLVEDRTITRQEWKLKGIEVDSLKKLTDIQRRRLESSTQSHRAQIAEQEAKIMQAKALLKVRESEVAALQVRAGGNGVLQQMLVEVGQWATPGMNLAKVSDPSELTAVIRIPETEARETRVGLRAFITVGDSVVRGRVARIDPAVQAGTVSLDVELRGEMPIGARPDLAVEGTLEVERLPDVLYVGRPVFAGEHQRMTLFKLTDDEREAIRIDSRLGRISSSSIEIVDGLSETEKVILSDMSPWEEVDRVRVK